MRVVGSCARGYVCSALRGCVFCVWSECDKHGAFCFNLEPVHACVVMEWVSRGVTQRSGRLPDAGLGGGKHHLTVTFHRHSLCGYMCMHLAVRKSLRGRCWWSCVCVGVCIRLWYGAIYGWVHAGVCVGCAVYVWYMDISHVCIYVYMRRHLCGYVCVLCICFVVCVLRCAYV